MKPVADFFKGLFDSQLWPARWYCGYWSDFHGWLYILSDLMIWIAYFLIPVIIFNYVSRRKQVIKYPGIYLLFGAFILLCGSTHFLDASMFWVPMYRLNALVRFLTAVVSLMTVYFLIKILPEAFKQKTSVELEREIGRRELAELKLAEANRDLEAFASIASHDLQEPLRKIKTFSSLLYEANTGNFTLESRELTEKIIHSAERMQELVNDVLSLSILSELITPGAVEIKKVISNALNDLEIKIREKAASIHVGDIPPVWGNANYLTQLFLNLISNAIKFNLRKPVISISGEQLGDRVMIYIRDNGIGIGEKDIKRIFEPFTRLNAKSDFEGSGIGLTICRKIVEIHKGSIHVRSNPEEGTTFTIELPAANGQTPTK
jgi:two-component system, chemotaxis family, sensor kinase Cph1